MYDVECISKLVHDELVVKMTLFNQRVWMTQIHLYPKNSCQVTSISMEATVGKPSFAVWMSIFLTFSNGRTAGSLGLGQSCQNALNVRLGKILIHPAYINFPTLPPPSGNKLHPNKTTKHVLLSAASTKTRNAMSQELRLWALQGRDLWGWELLSGRPMPFIVFCF